MTLIVGIDPGLKGAIAWVTDQGALHRLEDMPVVDGEVNPALLAELLRGYALRFVLVERQQSMPKQGVASSFKTGVGYGMILGVVAALGQPWRVESSTVWKKRMGLTSDKERSRKAALERWPSQSDYFKRKMDEGRAEAALLAVSALDLAPTASRSKLLRRTAPMS